MRSLVVMGCMGELTKMEYTVGQYLWPERCKVKSGISGCKSL